jgi:hypothetical protein
MKNKPMFAITKFSKRQQIENGTYIPINDIRRKEEKEEKRVILDDTVIARIDWTEFSELLRAKKNT